MRQLTIADVEWTLVAEREDVGVRGNALASGDEEEDRAAEGAILADLEAGNEWAWCFVVLTGSYKGLESRQTLGCCSYANEAEFKAGGYYDDLQAEALADLQSQAEALCGSMA